MYELVYGRDAAISGEHARTRTHTHSRDDGARASPILSSNPKPITTTMALRATLSAKTVKAPQASGLRAAVQRVATTAGVSVASLAVAPLAAPRGDASECG
jgi:hypothetical protein